MATCTLFVVHFLITSNTFVAMTNEVRIHMNGDVKCRSFHQIFAIDNRLTCSFRSCHSLVCSFQAFYKLPLFHSTGQLLNR